MKIFHTPLAPITSSQFNTSNKRTNARNINPTTFISKLINVNLSPSIQPRTARINNTANFFSADDIGPRSFNPCCARGFISSRDFISGGYTLYIINGANNRNKPIGTIDAINQVPHVIVIPSISVIKETVIALVAIPVKNNAAVPCELTYINIVKYAPSFLGFFSDVEPTLSAILWNIG
ncbi:hypothetical protein SDC9_170352 [bioreactor metagenome]|uniref:Uncharacterized protein n=1 Tax=bioreactor metagenome TaxID=1076179 RepID=A0A645G7T3_9ZZZZ